jgi:hypothetical protein
VNLTLISSLSRCPVCGSFAVVSASPTLSWCEREACLHSWNPEALTDADSAATSASASPAPVRL